MRLIAPRNAGPAAVNKYLLPHEHQVITVRKHPAVLIGPIAIALAGLLIALVLGTTVLMHSHNGIIVLVLVVVALLLYLGYRTWEWSEDYFVVTSDRMLQASGVFTRKIAMMPLVKVTDMSFKRSTLGRMLGFGQFILESAGQDQALRTIDHVPYPEQLYLEICALIFPAEKIPCPQCDGQGVLIQQNEDGEETTYLCPLCKGRKTVSGDTLVAENRDFGDD
ncbi:MAG TPA: PH domain-containing protein [Streptosporangiaceae bacterium]|jgi:membrane protein YdbS with pleckstrin-like domain|nr:PH domain-containing protein [Streptosporangiaceae bacterium]